MPHQPPPRSASAAIDVDRLAVDVARADEPDSCVDDVVQFAVPADKGLLGRFGEERRFRLALAIPGTAVDDARRDRVDPDGREVRGEVADGEVDRTVGDSLDDRPRPWSPADNTREERHRVADLEVLRDEKWADHLRLERGDEPVAVQVRDRGAVWV